jgi:hypothetical protein
LVDSINTLDTGVVKEVVLGASNADNKLKLDSLNYQKQLIKEEKEFEKINAQKKEEEKKHDITTGISSNRHQLFKLKLTPQIIEALEVLASKSAVVAEREKLNQLKAKQTILDLKVDGLPAIMTPSPSAISTELPNNDSSKTQQVETRMGKVVILANGVRQKLLNLRKSLQSSVDSHRSKGATHADVLPVGSVDVTTMQVKNRVQGMISKLESEIEAVIHNFHKRNKILLFFPISF